MRYMRPMVGSSTGEKNSAMKPSGMRKGDITNSVDHTVSVRNSPMLHRLVGYHDQWML